MAARTPRQIHFVTGKGGVGKSIVSCALARRFVREGDRTLLAQVNAKDAHAGLLGSGPIGDDIMALGPRLWAVNLTPAQAIREYALMTLKLETLYKAVFENRLTKTFLRFAPSLNELTMMGKLWFHAEEREGALFGSGEARFDRIVVDLPSTGHALKLIAVARVIAETVKVGPMAEKTRLMAEVFADPRRTTLHIVTLPEELPVNETLELLAAVDRERTVHVGHLIANQVTARAFDERTEPMLERVSGLAEKDAALGPIIAAGRRRLGRERLEARELARLLTAGRPIIDVPLFGDGHFAVAQVDRVGALLEEIP